MNIEHQTLASTPTFATLNWTAQNLKHKHWTNSFPLLKQNRELFMFFVTWMQNATFQNENSVKYL